MTFYNEKNKNDLIKAVKEKAIDLDNLFVADNLRVIGLYEFNKRTVYKNAGIEYEGKDYGCLADFVACEMEGTNGNSWQFSTTEVIDIITDMYEEESGEVA